MALMNEKETCFELVEALLKYIESLQVAGAVLIFLPGWNLIYSMQRHLETSPHFGNPGGSSQRRSAMLFCMFSPALALIGTLIQECRRSFEMFSVS